MPIDAQRHVAAAGARLYYDPSYMPCVHGIPRLLGRAALFAGLILLTASATAFGHASFLESSPQPGARLAVAPPAITMAFTEPLNQRLTRATVRNAETGETAPVSVLPASGRTFEVRPRRPLQRGAYQVRWHTVSTLDGHAYEGSFGFGVQVDARGGESVLVTSPLARNGWLRVLARSLLYLTLLPFAGALLLGVLLRQRHGQGSWLTAPLAETDETLAREDDGARRRARALVLATGLLAGLLAALTALVEGADAAGGLSVTGLRDFLLTNPAGLARIAVVILVLVAWGLSRGSRRLAAFAAVLALAAVALSGHAASAPAPLLAVPVDVAHLIAGSVWVGGIVLLTVSWGPALGRIGADGRRVLMRFVLPRFGTVALPAFVVVVVTGSVSSLLQLGSVSALWTTSYGVVLLVKLCLVVALTAAGWAQAKRLRPAILAAPGPAPGPERRHWRLLRGEPLIAAAVVVAVGFLVVFPSTPSSLADDARARAKVQICDPCPLPVPAADELAVGEWAAGRMLVAAWIRREGSTLSGALRAIDQRGRPAPAGLVVPGARMRSCGKGCVRFRGASARDTLTVRVRIGSVTDAVRLPARWQRDENRRASKLVRRALATMRDSSSARMVEEGTSAPGTGGRSSFRLRAPDRIAYRTDGGLSSVTIGRRRWLKPQGGPWLALENDDRRFRTRTWWQAGQLFVQGERLLGIERRNGRRIALLSYLDSGSPGFVRMRVDLSTMRVLDDRTIVRTQALRHRYFAIGEPVSIEPPPTG